MMTKPQSEGFRPLTASPEWLQRNFFWLLSRSDEEVLRSTNLPKRATKAQRAAATRKNRDEVAAMAVTSIWPDAKLGV